MSFAGSRIHRAYLENHSLTVFAILMTGFFGAANFRKSQTEALARAEAARSRIETAKLRSALERAEAAETANRRMVERMRAANMLARAAHKLKGASANLHVNTLAALTQDLEARAKAGAATVWRADVDNIAAEFERVAAALQAAYEAG